MLRIRYLSSDCCSSDLECDGRVRESRPSAEPSRDGRAEAVCKPERQLLPGRDLKAIFGIERIDLTRRRPVGRAGRVNQRPGLETPILLEGEGAGAELGAAEIEARAQIGRAHV